MSLSLVQSQLLSVGAITTAHRRRAIARYFGIVVLSLFLAFLILAYDLFSLAGLLACVGLALTLVRPRYGVYASLAIVLLFEGASDDPLMAPGRYLLNSLQSTAGANGLILIPIEVLLLLTTAAWLAHMLMKRKFEFSGGALGRPMLLFFLALQIGR